MKKTKYTTKWIKALRSGKYRQGDKALRVGIGYCCLGVACEIYPHGKWDGEEYILSGSRSVSTLNDALKRYYGLGDMEQRELATANDKGTSFEEIANVIERSIEYGAEITGNDFQKS